MQIVSYVFLGMYRLKVPKPRQPYQDLSFAVEFKKQQVSLKQICQSPQNVFIKMSRSCPKTTPITNKQVLFKPKSIIFQQKPFQQHKLQNTVKLSQSIQIKRYNFSQKDTQKSTFRRQKGENNTEVSIVKNASNLLELSQSDEMLNDTEIISNRIIDIDIFSELSQ